MTSIPYPFRFIGKALAALLFLSFNVSVCEADDTLRLKVESKDVETLIQTITNNADLSKENKETSLYELQESLKLIANRDKAEEERKNFKFLREGAPERLKEIEIELKGLREQIQTRYAEYIPINEVKQLIAQTTSLFESSKQDIENINKESDTRIQRRAAIPTLISELNTKQEKAQTELATLEKEENKERTQQARELLLRTQIETFQAQARSLEEEFASYDTRNSLIVGRLDLAKTKNANAKTKLDALNILLEKKREAEIKKQQEEAKRALKAAAQAHRSVLEVVNQNEQISKERSAFAAKLTENRKNKEKTTQGVESLAAKHEQILKKVEVAGRTEAIGVLLHTELDDLPEISQLEQKRKDIQTYIEQAQLRLIDVELRRSRLININEVVEQQMMSLNPAIENEWEKPPIERELVNGLNTQWEYLSSLQSDLNSYLVLLVDWDTEIHRYIESIDKFQQYVKENILWIANLKPLDARDVKAINMAATALSNQDIAEIGQAIVRQMKDKTVSSILVITAIALMIFASRSFKKRSMTSLSSSSLVRKNNDLKPTLHSFLWIIAESLCWPCVFYLTALFINGLHIEEQLRGGLASGLKSSAEIVFTTGVLLRLCRHNGVGISQFKWNRQSVKLTRKYLSWGAVFLIVGTFIIDALNYTKDGEWQQQASRLIFVTLLLAIAIVVATFLKLNYPKRIEKKNSAVTKSLTIFIGVILPLSLASLAAMGYFYTAYQLNNRLLHTIWLLMALVTANGFIAQWIWITRVKMIEEEKRKEEESKSKPPFETESEPEPEEQFGWERLDKATRQLFQFVMILSISFGLWYIWSPVLPAMREIGANKVIEFSNGDSVIKLGQIVLSLIALIFTIIAGKNVPVLLDYLVLQRTNLTAGSRYAVCSLVVYLIFIIGTLAVCRPLGLQWSNIQWLVAAVSVGLGFGLQEIFANFVSGLILLVERPIRIGDVVTVGNTTGTVEKIRIRGTTVKDFDRKELIVPNKEFVTGKLVNWTLTDPITRLTIPVGIAYGSSVSRAREIIFDIVKKHPLVMEDPEPKVWFKELGDSSLNFTVFVYIPSIESRHQTPHEILSEIVIAFEKEGIQIPFPQRDLHLRSINPDISASLKEKE